MHIYKQRAYKVSPIAPLLESVWLIGWKNMMIENGERVEK